MSNDIEKLPLTSMDVKEDRIEALRQTFPEAFKEGKIDCTTLQRSLGEWVDPGKERFGLNWPGKADCMRTIQQPSVGTLLPMREESVNFDTTENLIIEGDNLEALKLLQKSYYGKVKMIYIDPPYNTGNEFIYPDNFQEGLQDYLRYSGQVDAEGLKLSANTESDGRYHSKWLTMMYPRLFLARNLLRDDGVIFVSIDDNEIHNLRALMNDVFGEDNFVAQIVWQRSKKGDAKLIANVHEYILCYVRDKARVLEAGVWRQKKEGAEDVLAQYVEFKRQFNGDHEKIREAMQEWYRGLSDNDPRKNHKHYNWSDDRGLYFAADFAGPDDGRESRPRHDIIHPITGKPCKKPSTGWRWDEAKTKWALEQKPPRIHFGADESTIPNRKSYLEEISTEPYSSVFYRDGRSATLEVEGLVGKGWFPFPKNTDVLAELIELVTGPDDLILDFFAGSGSTAHAILNVNKTHRTKRKFILVQLPEATGKEAYATIAHICRKRIQGAIESLSENAAGQLQFEEAVPMGFRAFQLSASNFKVWSGDADNLSDVGKTLQLFADHVDQDRQAEDILYELLLKAGFPLTAPVEKLSLAGKEVFSVSDGALLICLDHELTLEVIETMVERAPQMILCLDEGFKSNDQLKVNAVQTVKSRNQNDETDIVFRVV